MSATSFVPALVLTFVVQVHLLRAASPVSVMKCISVIVPAMATLSIFPGVSIAEILMIMPFIAAWVISTSIFFVISASVPRLSFGWLLATSTFGFNFVTNQFFVRLFEERPLIRRLPPTFKRDSFPTPASAPTSIWLFFWRSGNGFKLCNCLLRKAGSWLLDLWL